MLVAQLVINGLGAGAIYAFVALGFALIYNATGVLHLAHGAVFALGGYAFYSAVVLLKMPIPVGCLVAVCASSLFGIAIEKLVYRPLRARKSEHASSMIASIGVLTLGQSVLGIVFGTDSLAMQTEPLKTISVFGLYLNYVHITAAVLALVIFSAIQVLLVRSQFGRAIRAFSDNPKLSRVFGINSDHVNTLVYGLGSGLAAIAACLISFELGNEARRRVFHDVHRARRGHRRRCRLPAGCGGWRLSRRAAPRPVALAVLGTLAGGHRLCRTDCFSSHSTTGPFWLLHDDPPGLGRWIIFCTSPRSSYCMPALSLRSIY